MNNSKTMPFKELTDWVEEHENQGIFDTLVLVLEDLTTMMETSTAYVPDEIEAIYEPVDGGQRITMRLYNTQNKTTVADRFWYGVLVVRTDENNIIVEIVQAYVTLMKARQ